MGVLNPEFMSPEDSASEDEAPDESGSKSDDETPRRKEGEKKLICHPLTWRNRECQNTMDSLDRN